MSDGPAIGWKFVAWTGERLHCAVKSCSRSIVAGHVRVDRPDPRAGDPVLCVDCYGLVMLGIDPDPSAPVPEWEKENRAASSN